MKKIFLFMIIPFVLSACFPAETTWRQKISLHLDTPDGPVVASSVVEIMVRDSYGTMFDVSGVGALSHSQHGEAVVADLGNGGYLFALIEEKMSFQILDAYKSSYLKAYDQSKKREKAWYSRWIDGLAVNAAPQKLSIKSYPKLVTFDDVADPTSVRLVDYNDLAAVFGEGYALRKMTLQIVDEPMTLGVVEEVLGWLAGYNEYLRPKIEAKENGAVVSLKIKPISPAEFNSEVFR